MTFGAMSLGGAAVAADRVDISVKQDISGGFTAPLSPPVQPAPALKTRRTPFDAKP